MNTSPIREKITETKLIRAIFNGAISEHAGLLIHLHDKKYDFYVNLQSFSTLNGSLLISIKNVDDIVRFEKAKALYISFHFLWWNSFF